MINYVTNTFLKGLVVFLLSFLMIQSLHAQDDEKTIVEQYGQLSVDGNKIVNKDGASITLRGMSLFWSQWGGKYYNSSCVKWLKDDWKVTVVRAAMGNVNDPSTEMEKIIEVIDAAIEEGIYVIVDWHDHHAEDHQAEAIEFFKEIATLYGNKPNIIYEIYNEPLQISWSNIIKPYAEAVISEIQAIDSTNIIIVGTPTWSQDVDVAANNPIEAKNIAYALHFYAATHKQSLRNKAKRALSKGIALFVSEFGTVESSGDGPINYDEVEKWFDLMEENNLSWCNWSIMDKDETSAALVPGANSQGSWSDSEITTSGKLVRDKIHQLNIPTDVKDFEESKKKR